MVVVCGTPTGDSSKDKAKVSRLIEKCPKILRRTVVCACGLRLRTRPEELKFQLWSRLSEKYKKLENFKEDRGLRFGGL